VTLEIPWLYLVEIDIFDDVEVDPSGCHLLPEVVIHELFIGRVESETRRNQLLMSLRLCAAHAHQDEIYKDHASNLAAGISLVRVYN
jgi:hypothetical protein